MEDDDFESKEAAKKLAYQFFMSRQESIVKLFYFRILYREMTFGITYRLLEIKEERLINKRRSEVTCRYKTLARDFLKRLKFSKLKSRGVIIFENSEESSTVANLILSNLSRPPFVIYRVIQDFSFSLDKKDRYKFVKDIHIRKWRNLVSIGYRSFPEICTGMSNVADFQCVTSCFFIFDVIKL